MIEIKVTLRPSPHDPPEGAELLAAWRVVLVEPEPGGGHLLTLVDDPETPGCETLAVIGITGAAHHQAMIWWRDSLWSSPAPDEMRWLVTGKSFNSALGSGYFYCPYVPLTQTPVVLDPSSYSPNKGIITRYGKKLLQGKP